MAQTNGGPVSAQERPPSDPSELTTQQILREASILRELLESNATGANAVVEQKFAAVDRQFDLVERMRVEQKKDTKDAVDAALTAQKEAVKEQTTAFGLATAKSEAAMTEQLKQLNATFTAAIKGVTDLLNDTKDRISKVEAMRIGGEGAVNNRRLESGQVLSILSFAAAVVAIIYSILQG